MFLCYDHNQKDVISYIKRIKLSTWRFVSLVIYITLGIVGTDSETTCKSVN